MKFKKLKMNILIIFRWFIVIKVNIITTILYSFFYINKSKKTIFWLKTQNFSIFIVFNYLLEFFIGDSFKIVWYIIKLLLTKFILN